MTDTSKTRQGRAPGRQIQLPLSKAVEIGFRNMRVRFGRTLITAGGVVLGISFLTFVCTSQAIQTGLIESASEELVATLSVVGEEAQAQKVWLVTLSLLVSTVGITNAMLMAVTERYREIGTMKCLGALDNFVVKMFMVESAFQGMVGSLIGCVIGLPLATLVMYVRYGKEVLTTFPTATVFTYGLIGLVIGLLLSVISAIYPAYVAAKMVPADALRSQM